MSGGGGGGGGRVILITGAASGIGAALAKTLAAEEGCCLLLHTRSSVAALDEVSASCSESGATVETALADIAEVGGAKSLVDACIAKFGRLDCVVVSSANTPKQHALTSPAASALVLPACVPACLSATRPMLATPTRHPSRRSTWQDFS